MMEYLNWIIDNQALLFKVAGIVGTILSIILADALHDVVKGVEVSGSPMTKTEVKNQRSAARPWAMVAIHLMKRLAEVQNGSKS
jgi:hypothetical protein